MGRVVLCQACGAANSDEEEFCSRCQSKLFVVSGPPTEEAVVLDEEVDEEEFSFDEHLLERISILEEAVKHTAESVQQILGLVQRQERAILVGQAGLGTLRDVLDEKRVLAAEDWSERWEASMDYQLMALEKREQFTTIRDRIAALYRGPKREDFVRLLDETEQALAALDVDGALETLGRAFSLDADNPDLAYFLGELHFNDGRGERALPFFERVLELVPDHPRAMVYSGVIKHERGDGEGAERLLTRALELDPEAFLPNFSLGAVYAGAGELEKATALLERAVETDPMPQALFLLGSCLYEASRLGRAIDTLRRVVRLDPGHEEAHHLLGLCYLDRGWKRRALEAFRSAQTLNPTKIRYQDLVRYLSGQDRSPLPGMSPTAARLLREAEVQLADGQAEAALSAYRAAIEAEPENPTLLISYAMACLQANRSQETEAVTRRLLDLEPGDMLKAAACATLIEALRSEGRFAEGNQLGRRLLQEGESNFSRTIAYYEMAFNLAEMGEDLDRALDYAKRALELSPEELRQFPLAAIGWVHYKRHEFDEAVEFLARSSEAGPSATTLTHLGMALLASGEEREARQALAEAREIGGRGVSLEQRMMECLKASDRLLRRVRHGHGG